MFWILGAIALVILLAFKVNSVNVDLNKLPHIDVILPDGYKSRTILNTGESGLFLLQGIRMISNNSYESKVFLISQDGKVLDEFQGSKHIGSLRNITSTGIVASDYSSPYVGGNIYFMISIKNNKIILDKTTNEKLKIFESPDVKDIPTVQMWWSITNVILV